MSIKQNILAKMLLIAALASSIASGAEPQAIDKGKVIDKVICRSDSEQSYALFLPSGYSQDKRWPVVYCFDPGARGRLPVERFKDAAEKYGYIIVGSNNSRNGPTEVGLAAIKAMLDDTQARFSVDPRRIYMAGFSGGARVASSIGSALGGATAGVIACGAGFPPGLSPSRSIPFPLFGTAGTEDFNFPEVKQLSRALDGYAIANRVAIFEGGHDWPPAALCMEAIEWMELQAMKSARRAKDEQLIAELFNKRAERARAFEASKKTYEAFLEYDAIAADFKGLKDAAEFEKRAGELKESKEVKLALKQEQEIEKEQRRRAGELYALKASLKDPETGEITLADLKRNIANLKKKSDDKEATGEKIVARRVLNQFFILLYEESRILLSRKMYEQAAEDLSIATIIAPDNPRLLYNLACAYSLNKDKGRAIEALKRSVEKGFHDVAALESDKDLEPLREDASYKRIIEDLKKKS